MHASNPIDYESFHRTLLLNAPLRLVLQLPDEPEDK